MTNALNASNQKLLSEVPVLVDTSDPYRRAMFRTIQKRLKKLEALKILQRVETTALSKSKKTKINLKSKGA